MKDETVMCGDGITRSVKQLQGTHREAYPEQYTHPRVGELVRVEHGGREIARGKIERVVHSRFGQLAHLEGSTPADAFYALGSCIKVQP